MSKPIRLWRPRQTRTSDDAGTTILKTTLPQAPRTSAPYQLAAETREPPNHVPSLTYFCIRALLDYPDQIHALGSLRLTYSPPETPEAYDILRELIPSYRTDQPLDLAIVDPRLWALLIQLYNDLPAVLRLYTVPLADAHLPLLQRIPPTSDFALVTILELPGCRELTDQNVLLLKDLHNLCAFDASGTALGAWGVKTLAKTLTICQDEDTMNTPSGPYRRGPWGLRILSLRNCMNIDDDIFNCLPMFPLLSVVDIRGTPCRPQIVDSFRPCAHDGLFHPTPLLDALDTLDALAQSRKQSLFAHARPYKLRIHRLEHEKPAPASSRARDQGPSSSLGNRRDVFLPPRTVSLLSLGAANRLLESPISRYRYSTSGHARKRASSAPGSTDTRFILFRFPPDWSLLPASAGYSQTPCFGYTRKKVKLDVPLEDPLSVPEGVCDRADVKASMTALQASLKQREEALTPDSRTRSEAAPETERLVSRNPFARTAQSAVKTTKACPGSQKDIAVLSPRVRPHPRVEETPPTADPDAASPPKAKALKPISQLRIPPPPAPPSGSKSRKREQSVRPTPKSNKQMTISESLFADGKTSETARGSIKPETKGGPVPPSTKLSAKSKPASTGKPRSRTSFDLRAWCASGE
ncbi:uncharacterized protein C8Q71DRAFT_220484 [Rhodofomes roseus]|uniref:Uncharacterized protein n=1 Tax=Rhodofomes roseus TaxID=34475 RepID=A0ABQ8KUS3_9APHY|nr:uncharacterized protein C8Q71DRAFT_220484 [Rhodofomes roseus]KAH9842778.1 hypothetical protein C8Q71DRAFT_220484 [Rhodofomes roseus]